MEFFDSHCHFDFAEFDSDRAAIWYECDAQAVHYLMIPGVAPDQWTTAAKIAQTNHNIFVGVGLHPWWIAQAFTGDDIEKHLTKLRQQLADNTRIPHCVAVGECGLDALIATPLPMQQKVLDVHIEFAQEKSLPLILHCRKAHNELIQQLKTYRLNAGGVIHGFSGSYETAMQYWAMGFRLGIGGTITYERANKTRQAVKQLPLESLVLETDAPDMPLQGKQGERNTPLNIVAIAQTLADLRGESLEQIAVQTTHNAQQLFKIIT